VCADRSNRLINRNAYDSLFADDTCLSLMRKGPFPLCPVKFKTKMKWLFRSRSFTFLMDKLAGPDPAQVEPEGRSLAATRVNMPPMRPFSS